MKIFLALLISTNLFAYVLDFPGDEAPEPPKMLPINEPVNKPAKTPSISEDALINKPQSAELDPQLVLLLSMMSKEKLYALKLALDKMFAPAQASAAEPEPEYKDIKITVNSAEGSKTYNLKTPKVSPLNDSNIKINLK